jgi:hypothetical protein
VPERSELEPYLVTLVLIDMFNKLIQCFSKTNKNKFLKLFKQSKNFVDFYVFITNFNWTKHPKKRSGMFRLIVKKIGDGLSAPKGQIMCQGHFVHGTLRPWDASPSGSFCPCDALSMTHCLMTLHSGTHRQGSPPTYQAFNFS